MVFTSLLPSSLQFTHILVSNLIFINRYSLRPAIQLMKLASTGLRSLSSDYQLAVQLSKTFSNKKIDFESPRLGVGVDQMENNNERENPIVFSIVFSLPMNWTLYFELLMSISFIIISTYNIVLRNFLACDWAFFICADYPWPTSVGFGISYKVESSTLLQINRWGPINLSYKLISHPYIFILVNYFLKFTSTKSYLIFITDNVINIFNNCLSPIYAPPAATYSHNGSYFINKKIVV